MFVLLLLLVFQIQTVPKSKHSVCSPIYKELNDFKAGCLKEDNCFYFVTVFYLLDYIF